MLTFTDTHCHLNYYKFDDDLSEVINRAETAGLTRIMLPGIDLNNCEKGVQIANQHESCFAAVGIHPNDANTWKEDTLEQLTTLAKNNPKVLAIGEIGLDYYRDWTTPEDQKKILHKQLTLAEELSLPIIVHIRDTIEESFEILFQWQKNLQVNNHPLAQRPGVLHAFPGTTLEATQAIAHNFKIGVGGPVTFKSAHQRRAMVKELPLDVILLETDAPFLAPHPHRGKRNEPAYISHIAEKIAEVKNVSINEISKITTENAQKLFQW